MTCLEGDAVWEAGERGEWSVALGAAALAVVDKDEEQYAAMADGGGPQLETLRACVGPPHRSWLRSTTQLQKARTCGGPGATLSPSQMSFC